MLHRIAHSLRCLVDISGISHSIQKAFWLSVILSALSAWGVRSLRSIIVWYFMGLLRESWNLNVGFNCLTWGWNNWTVATLHLTKLFLTQSAAIKLVGLHHDYWSWFDRQTRSAWKYILFCLNDWNGGDVVDVRHLCFFRRVVLPTQVFDGFESSSEICCLSWLNTRLFELLMLMKVIVVIERLRIF